MQKTMMANLSGINYKNQINECQFHFRLESLNFQCWFTACTKPAKSCGMSWTFEGVCGFGLRLVLIPQTKPKPDNVHDMTLRVW